MKIKVSVLRDPVNLAFLISIFYWIYLVFTSRMVIVWDAISYESLGKMLAQQGWVEFFKTGPNREPFYPALIAISMRLGKIFSLSYQLIQIVIQLSILFLTQILTLRILRLLKINKLLSALTILYLGISPAIVNSALSLYSEIATYPFILAIMLLAYKSWLSFAGPRIRTILLAIATGLLFVIMALNKGIFEFMTPFFLFLFIISAFSTRNRKIIINSIVYLFVALAVFYSLISSYKSANKSFNGNFALTDRSWSLYGSAVQRIEPLTMERFLIAVASVPGEGMCQSMFGEKKCSFWSFTEADRIGMQKTEELSKANIPPNLINRTIISLSIQKALQNPCQYVLLVSIEGLKMFFWESTQIGYVIYPSGLKKLFIWRPFKNGLRLGISLLTLFAFVYLIWLLWRERKNVLKSKESLLFLYICLLFIFSFVSLYSLFYIITRYILPITPLYLIIIAYVFQKICFCRKSKSLIHSQKKYKNALLV